MGGTYPFDFKEDFKKERKREEMIREDIIRDDTIGDDTIGDDTIGDDKICEGPRGRSKDITLIIFENPGSVNPLRTARE